MEYHILYPESLTNPEASTRNTIWGCLKASSTLFLQDNILDVVRLRVVGAQIYSIPGHHLFGDLYRRLKDVKSSRPPVIIQALLKEGCILQLNLIYKRV